MSVRFLRKKTASVSMRGLRTLVWFTATIVALSVQSAEVMFADVTKILVRECVMCHQPYDAKGELTLHPAGAWKSLVEVESRQVGMLLVTPGNLEQSYLYRKLTDTHAEVGGSGDRMPYQSDLAPHQLETIRKWIEQGAKNN